VTAKRAPIGLKKPVESSLNGVSNANASKFDRSAMWTTCGQQSYSGADHDPKRPNRLSEMLALEKGRVIGECGSGARWSVLSGKRHQGRTVQRTRKQLAARLLVRDASFSLARLGVLLRFIR
jgi:hypothetical protein